MTDIVNRLRNAAEMPKGMVMTDVAMREAADEIERLRAALKEIAGLEYDHVAMVDIARIALEDKP